MTDRRTHAAATGRVIALGLSASATFTLVTAMTLQARSTAGGATTAPPDPAPLVIRVTMPDGRTTLAVPTAPTVRAASPRAATSATSNAS